MSLVKRFLYKVPCRFLCIILLNAIQRVDIFSKKKLVYFGQLMAWNHLRLKRLVKNTDKKSQMFNVNQLQITPLNVQL